MIRGTSVLLLCGVVSMYCTAQAEAASRRLEVGKPAIDFTLEDANEKEFRLSGMRGQTVILVVVAEADSRERRQKNMKDCAQWIQSIKEEYGDRVVLVGMIWLDVSFLFKGKARGKIRESQSIRFLIDWDGDVLEHYGDKALPTIVVIDKDGSVRDIVKGSYSAESSRRLFDKLESIEK